MSHTDDARDGTRGLNRRDLLKTWCEEGVLEKVDPDGDDDDAGISAKKFNLKLKSGLRSLPLTLLALVTIIAFLLAGFSLLSALLFHFDFSDQMQSIMFMKNLSIAGGFLMIVSLGGGAYSLDNYLGARDEK